ncbi:MAG: DUF6106 family protein [Lachnospiraceae bacterium]|nr:DUF6106 family protein [Lachnospiraceae bacterium]
MADTFVEVLIARQTPAYAPILKIGTIVLAVVSFLLGLINWIFLLIFVALILVYVWVFPKLNVEYEYTYLGDQLNVDKIFNRSSRKKAGEYPMDKIEVIALKNSSQIKPMLENPKSGAKIVDYTSHMDGAVVYAFIYSGKEGRQIVLFEPNEKLLGAMKYTSPRKVYINC